MGKPYNPDGGSRVFYTIVNLSNGDTVFARRVSKETEGAQARTLGGGPNKGDTVHEVYFASLYGIPQDFRVKTMEKQTLVELFLRDVDLVETVSWELNSGFTVNLLEKLWRCPVGEYVEIFPYDFVPKATKENPDPKRLKGFSLLCRGHKVTSKSNGYKKLAELVEGKPAFDEKFMGGDEEVYKKFYVGTVYKWVQNKVIPAFRENRGFHMGVASAEYEVPAPIEEKQPEKQPTKQPAKPPHDDDDLPF